MECKDTITVTGIMSGTSLDGLDVARVKFFLSESACWTFELEEFKCFEFPEDLRSELKNSMNLSGLDLSKLSHKWARFAAECASKLKGASELVASHGHTVFHQPENGFTVQIGSGATLAANVGLPVVCDLRSLDVAHGGTGAPLIPIVDELLFPEYDACINLGGFSNISLKGDGELLAWDIGPCNNLLNKLANEADLEYDMDGGLASSGEILDHMLSELLSFSYHSQSPPKSLGMEWINTNLLPVLEKFADAPLESRLHTSVEYIAKTISVALPAGKVLVTGGGAKNTYLIDRLKALSPSSDIIVPNPQLIDSKEALGFAFLGLLRWRGEENVRNSVTGARIPSSGGAVWLP